MSWLPFAIFVVVTIASFAVLLVVFGRKEDGLEGEPGRLSRPVKKAPRRPASQGTPSRNRREKAGPLSRPLHRLEDEAIPEVLPADDEAIQEALPADPEPAPETGRHERAPQPIARDEDFIAQWLADLSFPLEDQAATAEEPEATIRGVSPGEVHESLATRGHDLSTTMVGSKRRE
jgi:hypothetical protein